MQGEIKVTPDIFSPDNDGTDDFATIDYSFPAPGYVSNITIFDATGRPVRYLQRNSLSGTKGYYRWDGLDDKNRNYPRVFILSTQKFLIQTGRKNNLEIQLSSQGGINFNFPQSCLYHYQYHYQVIYSIALL